MSALAGLREDWRSTPRTRHIGRQAEQGYLVSAADQGDQAKAHSVAKLRGGFAEEAGFASTDRSEHVARPRPHLSKRPLKRSWEGRLRRRKCTERNCGTRGAPQKRRRGCMDWLHYVEHFYEGRGSGFANASRGPCRRRAARTTTP